MDYETYSPVDLLITAGNTTDVEHIDTTTDTVCSIVNTCSYRLGGLYAGDTTYSWLIGGYQESTRVERIDNVNYTVATTPAADLTIGQAGGGSLFGNSNCYLAGNSTSSIVHRFDTTTGTSTLLADLPFRVRECGGKADSVSGWLLGGVETNGHINTYVQKIDIATEIWTILTTLLLVDGTANHSSFYKNKNIWYTGGSTNKGMTGNVHKLDVSSNLSTAEFRSMLSLARTYPGGLNNASSGWSVAGYNLGYTSIVDRVDLTNDTTDANIRCNLNTARKDALVVGDLHLITNSLDDSTISSLIVVGEKSFSNVGSLIPYSLGSGYLSISSRVYIVGGQNYDLIYNTIYTLDLSNDTHTVLTNNSLTNRYSLFGVYDSSHSLYAGGIDCNQNEVDLVEKLDHSNDTIDVVITSSLPSVLANGNSFSLDQYAFVKSEDKFYQLDLSSDTWSTLVGTGLEIFISGSGLDNQGLFAGGAIGSTKTNRIDVYNVDTNIWINNKYQITSERSGLSSTSVSEKTWLFGGSKRSQVDYVESINHLAQYADIKSSGTLSSSKSRTSAFSNSEYAWIFGGYRLSAIDDLDKFDPYVDLATVVSRGPLSTPKHSLTVTAPVIIGERYSFRRTCIVPSLVDSDIKCKLVINGSDTRNCISPIPRGTHIADLNIIAPRIPIPLLSDRGCYLNATIREESNVQCRVAFSTYNQLDISSGSIDPFTLRYSTFSSGYEEIQNPIVKDDFVWIGGGLQISKYERVDSTTYITESRGNTFYPRMGGSPGTSSEQGWIGGGSVTQNIVELLIYSNDMITTGNRTSLSTARSYLASCNNSNHIWYWSGLDSNGLTGLTDKLDKSNDTIAADLRTSDLTRCRFKASFAYNYAYSIGGQVGAYGKDWIRYFSPGNDTVINSSTAYTFEIFDYAMSSYENRLYIFHHNNAYLFDPSTSVNIVKNNELDSYTQFDAHILGNKILLSGGTTWSESSGTGSRTDRLAIYDPINDTYTVENGMNYRRHNHWSCGYTSQVNSASDQVRSSYNSIGLKISDIQSKFERCSADNTLSCISAVGTRHDNDLNTIVFRQSGCIYTDKFELGFAVDINNILWKFTYNCDLPMMLGSMPTSSSRIAALSNSQTGFMLGGSGRSLALINYSTDTATKESLVTDDICESPCSIINHSFDYGYVFGGTRYIEAYNNSLVITDTIREFDFDTNTLSNLSIKTPNKITRAAASRCSDSFGYILGGSITEMHEVTDQIIRVDINSGLCSNISTILPMKADLHQAIVDIDGNIITSNGFKLDYTTETISSVGVWPSVYGESLLTQSANTLLIGGTTDRVEKENIKGLVTVGNIKNNYVYKYDQVTTIIEACSQAISTSFFNQPACFAYSYCSPLREARTTKNCIINAIGTYQTLIDTIVEFTYTYTDCSSFIHIVYDKGEDTKTCIYTSFGTDLLSATTKGKETYSHGKNCFIHLAVEHHDNDRGALLSAIDRIESDITANMIWEQLQSTLKAITLFPDFLTIWNDVNCSLLIGGKISTRRCFIPDTYKANWDLFRNLGSIEILNKEVLTGDLIEILHKIIKSDNTSLDFDNILQNVDDNFNNSDFIYSVDDSRGVIADEGVLIKVGSNMQIINLLIRLSGTDMWVSNDADEKFFIDYSEQYVIEGIGHIPITGNIMYIRLQLVEPLINDSISFEFKSVYSKCLLKLVPM